MAFGSDIVLLHVGCDFAPDFLRVLAESKRRNGLLNLLNRWSDAQNYSSARVAAQTRLENLGERRVAEGNVLSLPFCKHRDHLCQEEETFVDVLTFFLPYRGHGTSTTLLQHVAG